LRRWGGWTSKMARFTDNSIGSLTLRKSLFLSLYQC
jgi:hypothetical protein